MMTRFFSSILCSKHIYSPQVSAVLQTCLFVHNILCSVKVHVANWPPIGKELLTWLTACSLFYVYLLQTLFPIVVSGTEFVSYYTSSLYLHTYYLHF